MTFRKVTLGRTLYHSREVSKPRRSVLTSVIMMCHSDECRYAYRHSIECHSDHHYYDECHSAYHHSDKCHSDY